MGRLAPIPEIPPLLLEGAVCAQTDPEQFFPEKGGSAAKRICLDVCPELATCREYVETYWPPHGVWAGMTYNERNMLQRSRQAQVA